MFVRFLESPVKSDGIFASDFDLPRILKDYQARNSEETLQHFLQILDLMSILEFLAVTTRLSNTYLTWTNGASSSPDVFTAEITIRYPEQSIVYKPGFWQVRDRFLYAN